MVNHYQTTMWENVFGMFVESQIQLTDAGIFYITFENRSYDHHLRFVAVTTVVTFSGPPDGSLFKWLITPCNVSC